MHETEVNGILYNKIKIKQLKDGYRFSIDPILLSWFASLKSHSKVIDMGTGNGIIAILLARRFPDAMITGIDIVKEFTDIAKENVKINNMTERIKILNEDIRKIKNIFPPASFDTAVANPPYLPVKGSRLSSSWSKLVSRYEWKLNIEELIDATFYLLPTKGQLFLIYKPENLLRLFVAMHKYQIPPKEILFVHSYINKKAEFVLIRGVKGAKEQLRVLPPLILYNNDGTPTKDFKRVYEI